MKIEERINAITFDLLQSIDDITHEIKEMAKELHELREAKGEKNVSDDKA